MTISFGKFQGLLPGDIVITRHHLFGCKFITNVFDIDVNSGTVYLSYGPPHEIHYKNILKIRARAATQICSGCILKPVCKVHRHSMKCFLINHPTKMMKVPTT